jgi:hypothetical protein
MEYRSAGTPPPGPSTSTRSLGGLAGRGRRLATETKQAFRTTEFWIYLVILIGVLLAGIIADADEGSTTDGFGAKEVWLYAVILTVGYMISRGLAKSGSRDPYWDQPSDDGEDGSSIGDRVKAAAQVLKEGPDSETRTSQMPTSEGGRDRF